MLDIPYGLIVFGIVFFSLGWFICKFMYSSVRTTKEAKRLYAVISEVIKADPEKLKMVLIVRNDLKMTKGTTATQCCHAAIALYQKIIKETGELGREWRRALKQWEDIGAKKVVTKIESETEM